ncbi:MAG: prephenate dehydratase domain-containing protein [Anaerovoracaceae bacterium]
MKTNENEIDYLRQDIDNIDGEMVKLIEKRMRVAEKIAKYKEGKNLPIVDAMRERHKMDEITDMSADDLTSYTRILYSTIFEMSREHQRKILKSESVLTKEIRNAIDETPKLFPQKAIVACQGMEGAYSQLACDKLFEIPSIVYTKNFEGVFSAVNSGLCKYGVLPLENSTAGSVNQIYDLMLKYQFHIVKCVRLKIDHNLMVKKGTKRGDIKEIFSHEQAIMQCEEYLNEFENVKVTVCENTAVAAKMVAESDRKDIAALSSYSCAELYGLECIERSVQDNGNNYTKFICISKGLEIYPAANKTSLMMVVDHKPGALYKILARFFVLGINLVKLESRPIPDRDFEFMFYFDIESQIYSEEFVQLISELEEMSQEFKYLGSYMEIV